MCSDNTAGQIEKLQEDNERLRESLGYFKTRLRETSQRFFMLVRNLPDIVYLLDTRGKILFISKTISAYGYSPEELVGENIFEIVSPEDHARAAWHINERRRGDRRTCAFPLHLKRKNGSSAPEQNQDTAPSDSLLFDLYAEGRYASIDGESLTFTGTMGVARDLSLLPLHTASEDNVTVDAETLIPICSGCKRIRLKNGEWIDLESYLQDHCGMQMTHSICPRCSSRFYPDTGVR